MEKPNGKLLFYGDEVPIAFPQSFNKFIVLLREILGLDENFLSNVKLSYRDRDEDKIEIKSEEDYKIFMDDIQKGRQMAMTIEVKEESNLDIKKCSSSIINYVEKKSGNINNLSEEVKKNAIKLDEEEDEKNNKNLDLDENINNDFNINNKNQENVNQLIMNNNFNDNNIVKNSINENNNKNIIKIENNNVQNPQQNNINNQIQPKNVQNNNKIPQNMNQNNINQISQNIPQMSQNNNIPQMQQNQNMSQVNQSKYGNKYLYMISFPYACSLCRVGPIYRVMYFCKDCNLVICPRCEQREGERHFHPLYKVQNGSQFQYLNINGLSTMDVIMNKMEGAYNSVLGFFGAGNNRNENNPNDNRAQQQQHVPQLVSNVQLARNIYDLSNVSDQQIEDALIKNQGNIDQAVFSLVSK
jgi:hypothetical protein